MNQIVANLPFSRGLIRLGQEAAAFRKGEKIIDTKAYNNAIKKIDAYVANVKVAFPEYFQQEVKS